MGKASSSKKVARAARGGAAVRPNQRKLTFPLAVAAVVLLGIGLVVFSRDQFTQSTASADSEAPTTADHWHAAYGVYVCDAFLDPVADAKADTTGIHTHADGIIHVHPFTSRYGGKNATLGTWGEITDIDFGSSSITMPDGTTYENGYDCNGQPATVKVYVWPADDPTAEPTVYDRDFGKVRITQDRLAITIAVVPDGVDVPRPSSVATLDNLSDVENTGGASTTTVAGGVTGSSVVGPDGSVTTDSTVAGSDAGATPTSEPVTTIPGTP